MVLAGGGTCVRTQRAADVDDARCYLRRSSLKQCRQWGLHSGDLPVLADDLRLYAGFSAQRPDGGCVPATR
jgi:hypothetical protein